MQERLRYDQVPWLGAVEGYGPFEYATEKEWISRGYLIKHPSLAVEMRPYEDSKEVLDYYSKKDVWCPMTAYINREMVSRIRSRGEHLTQRNKFITLSQIMEEQKEKLRRESGDSITFHNLITDNVCTVFGRNDMDTETLGLYFCNIVYEKERGFFGEPNHILAILKGWNIPEEKWCRKMRECVARMKAEDFG